MARKIRPVPPLECVYTIASRALISDTIRAGGSGELIEGRPWVTAAKVAQRLREFGRPYPLLLADAARIIGVEWVAQVDSIDLLPDKGTRVRFSRLRPLPTLLPLDDLRKRSDDAPLSRDYIRPYMPCWVRGKARAAVLADPGQSSAVQAESLESLVLKAVQAQIDADPACQTISATTRTALVEARIGQGRFRSRMLALWEGRCALTGCALPQVLIASHAKPWHSCSNEERLDEFNGLLLAAHVDKLFDCGVISFTNEGRILYKASFDAASARALGLESFSTLRKVLPRHHRYLTAHRAHFGFLDSPP